MAEHASETDVSPSIKERFRHSFEATIWPAVILATAAVLVAALAGAILLYDGAWFLFQVLDTHRISIPQLRISFALMQWPAIWVAEATDSLPLTRFVFSLIVMAMPPISIAICWWIVRKAAPWLIVWPAIGIFIIDLPGQMHWIATSIRTNQLFWPILMAIFIGMPDRVVPVVIILLISALFMHPQVSAFLLAGAAAALVLGWQRPEQRQRLFSVAAVFVFAAIYRYGILIGGYETQEASLENQIGQWERSVLWLPLIAMISALIVAIVLVLRRYNISNTLNGAPGKWIIGVVAVIGTVAFIVWAADPELWRSAIDYRGPSMWHSLIIMGIAFLDVAIRYFRKNTTDDVKLRTRLANGAAVVFCITIVIQSVTWHGELNKVRSAMNEQEHGCIVAEDLPGFENSPLNFWSLPAASIGMQSTTPDYVVLPGHLCEQAVETGLIPMDLTNQSQDTPGRFMNMYHLRSRVVDTATCWQAYEAGWHDLEITGDGTRRWSMGTGVVVLVMDEAGEVRINGILDSLEIPNEVRLRVNGVQVRSIPIEGDRYRPLEGITVSLEKGPNVIDFISMRPASNVEGDSRDLAIAVVNLDFQAVESEELCVWRDEPADRPDVTPVMPGSNTIRSTPQPLATPSGTPQLEASPASTPRTGETPNDN